MLVFYSDNGELVNPVDMLWEWMDTNEIPLAVEIFAFIISLPIFVLIDMVGIVLSIIFGAFELVATVIYLIIVFLGYIIIAAKELFGI